MAIINIAELNIDATALVKSATEIKKQLDELKAKSKDIAPDSEEYTKVSTEIKALQKEYAFYTKAIVDNTKVTADEATKTATLNLALSENVTSIAEARAQNALLNKIRNETDVTTEKGKETLKQLNDKLNQNNDFIKENADAYLKQKINIGNYSNSIKEAFSNLNPLNGGLAGFAERANEAGGAGNLAKQSLSGMAQGFIGVTKASLAFIATPIGATIAGLVFVFGTIKNAMDRSAEATGKVSKVFDTFSGIANILLNALVPIGEFFINSYVKTLEKVALGTERVLKGISDGLKFLGLDDAAKGFDNFVESQKASIKASQDLGQAERDLVKAQREARLIQLEAQKNAEKQRQIRDDESKSIAERQEANEKLGAILKQQSQDELAIAKEALRVENLRIAQTGQTNENLDKRAEALTQIADIEERITGQESEQLVNRIALQKEAVEKQKENNQKAIDLQNQSLQLFLANNEARKKSDSDQLAFANEVYKKETDIARNEYKARLISKNEFDLKLIESQNKLIEQQNQIAVQVAENELKAFEEANKSKINAQTVFNAEIVQAELQRLNDISEAQAKAQTTQYELGLINAQEYDIAIREIDAKYLTDKTALETQFAETEKQRKLTQLQADREIELQRANSEFEAERIRIQQQYEIELADYTAQKTALSITEAQFNELSIQANKRKNDLLRQAELKNTTDRLNEFAKIGVGLEGLFGKSKAISSALALINGSLAVTEILKTPSVFPEPYASISRGVQIAGVVIQTGKAVADINGAKFAGGGLVEINGASHANGGVPIYAGNQYIGEAQGQEGIGIMNRGAFSKFMDFNNTFGDSDVSGGGFYAGGGVINNVVRTAEVDLVAGIREALESMPTPIVTVQDIQTESTNYIKVVQNANF